MMEHSNMWGSSESVLVVGADLYPKYGSNEIELIEAYEEIALKHDNCLVKIRAKRKVVDIVAARITRNHL